MNPAQDGRRGWSMAAYMRRLREEVGPVGLRPVIVLMGAAGLERFAQGAVAVFTPDIRDTFHLTTQDIAAAVAIAGVVPLLVSPYVGYLVDRGNRVRLAQLSCLIVGVVAVAMGLAPWFWLFVILLFLSGFGLVINEPVHNSLIADYYPPRALGDAFTFYLFAFAAIGLLTGPIGGGLGAIFGWRPAFVMLAVPALVAIVVLATIRDPGQGASLGMSFGTEERATFLEGFRRVSAVRSLRRTWLASFFFGGGVVAFLPLANTFFKDIYHYNAAARGGVTAVFGIGGLIGTVIGGAWVGRHLRSQRSEMLPVANGLMVVLFGAGIVLFGLSPFAAGSIVALGLASVGAAGFAPAYRAMVGLVTTPRLRGQAYSYSLIFVAIGGVLVSVTIGGIANADERAAMLVLGALMMMAGAIEVTARRFVARDITQAMSLQKASEVDAFLVVRELEVAYAGNIQILFGVDLEVSQGEIIALLGTNGAGKSTLLKAVAGLIDPIGGAIFFNGRDITHADAANKAQLGMALVPGDRGVFPGLTVADNLKIAAWMFRRNSAQVTTATERALGHFPVLRDRWRTQAGNLSGGEQQMLVLAQALMGDPKILMIDELSLGLAPVIVGQLLETVKKLAEDGVTILLVEQSVNVALSIAKRAVFMEKGEIRFSGPTAELLERPDVLRSVFLEGAASAVGAAPTHGGVRMRPAGSNGHRGDRAALEVCKVSKRFGGVAANEDVSIVLHEGEILGIIGPNGAGKTTLFDLISGYFPVDGGQIFLDGVDITGFGPDARARLGLGRSFQDSRLFPALTVSDTVRLAFERHLEVRDPIAAALNLPAVLDAETAVDLRVLELTEMLGLTAFRNKFVSELSTGTRRMVDLACILAHEPSVILFDEPSSGIAQREAEALGPLLRRIREMTGSSLLVIEHDMPLLTGLADEIVAMDLGQVVTRGLPQEVVNDPRVVAAYLGTSAEAAARSGALAEVVAGVPVAVAVDASANQRPTTKGRADRRATRTTTNGTRTPRGTR